MCVAVSGRVPASEALQIAAAPRLPSDAPEEGAEGAGKGNVAINESVVAGGQDHAAPMEADSLAAALDMLQAYVNAFVVRTILRAWCKQCASMLDDDGRASKHYVCELQLPCSTGCLTIAHDHHLGFSPCDEHIQLPIIVVKVQT